LVIYAVEIYSVDVTDRRRQILDAALAIADEQGLEAVSMRAVAHRVGLTPMALYPHVGSKDALLDGLVDRLLAELLPPVGDLPADDWQARLRALGHGLRDLARRHPATFSLLLARPSVTPDAVRATDAVYQCLLDAGVPEPEVPRVERLLSTFVIGYAASEVNGRFSSGTRDPRGRRAQFATDEVLAHHRLAPWLDLPSDWDAEFEADLSDLLAVIERVRDSAKPG
jgi:AcrR family transcriptional regulator